MGTQLTFSTSFHPQTDGQSEQTIWTLEDMLCACVLDFHGSWDDHLSPLCWTEIGELALLGPELVEQTIEKIQLIRARMKAAQDRHKSYADKQRRDLEFNVGDHVFLRVMPMRGVRRFGVSGKLSPRYMGPFEILKRYMENPEHVIDYHPLVVQEDASYTELSASIVDQKEKGFRNRTIPYVKVQWQ
ncbi:uncharacterized protein LOC127799728 [Diospyros lotus]|uniref:uncharacterized protein LOC127799728 n=1 Tax=Diospyros lotus TaxID=55363 RepID=UPI00224FADF4|nr:uncharacterized protein LOC127799728 [Diospyros lotus]